ncbi:MAG TPA: hypothetical protein VLA49_06570 [Anaerolineales bacterium]|nr:hypothetical protein [Anaerolineales bacterium]
MIDFSLYLPPLAAVQAMIVSTGIFALIVMWIKIIQSAIDVILGGAFGYQ